MVNNAEQTALNAAADDTNLPGYCLQWCREKAGIGPRFLTAATAWAYAQRKHYDRNPPRGAFVFWTGGSKGYGHIAISLGGGWVRSTDAGGSGRVATRTLAWFDTNWYSQHYEGWTDNVNGVTVPGVIDTRDGFDMADLNDLRQIVREELRDETFIEKVGDEVWQRQFRAVNANGVEVRKSAREYLTSAWETLKKL